jgi:hypothetical protein
MFTGRGTGTGKYSYHSRTKHNKDCMVSHMPEDSYLVRIAFRHNGETSIPVIKLDEDHAEMLWACLNSMAKDLKWEDLEPK